MDKHKLALACRALDAFFEDESAEVNSDEWKHNGQAWAERVEGWVLHAIERLEEELEEVREATRSEAEWWWLAVNGPSCAANFFPARADCLTVSPVPEQLIGFRTREEQLDVQKFMLTAPIEKVKEYMNLLPSRIDAGQVAYIRPKNPEPPTDGPTMWAIDRHHTERDCTSDG